MPWFIWLVIAAVALAGEAASNAFVLLYVGVAAAITAVLAALGVPFVLQLVVFIPLTLALLSVVRPRTIALLGQVPQRRLSGHGHMVDRAAIVEQQVTDHSGMIRLGSGEFWSARAYPPGTTIAVGAEVRIMFVDGLIAHVSMPTESGHLPELPGDTVPPFPSEHAEGA